MTCTTTSAPPPEDSGAPSCENGRLAACPFCGELPPKDLADTLYPSGVVWRERPGGMRSYHARGDRKPGDHDCWNVVCPCGAEVSADSREKAVEKWNRRGLPSTRGPADPWYLSMAELAAVYGEMCAINETPTKEQSAAMQERLKALRAQAVALHYNRIALASAR